MDIKENRKGDWGDLKDAFNLCDSIETAEDI